MAVINIDGFCGKSYQMRSLQLDNQNCINWYLTYDPTGKYKNVLLPRAGLALYLDGLDTQKIRGIIEENDLIYFVSGNYFYVNYPNGAKLAIGNLESSTGRVVIIKNQYQLLINDGINSYVYQYAENPANLIYPVGSFFKIKNATSSIESPVFLGTGLNDLTSSGTYTGDYARKYRVQIDSVKRRIGDVIFQGTGLNDMTVSGAYSGNTDKTYLVEIDRPDTVLSSPVYNGTGLNDLSVSGTYTGTSTRVYRIQVDSLNPFESDTFRWSDTDGATWNATYIPMVSDGQVHLLNYGVSISFAHATGHDPFISNFWWNFTATYYSVNTFRWSDSNGATWNASNININAGNKQTLNDGISILFQNASGHTLHDKWSFPVYYIGTQDTFRWSDNDGTTWNSSNVVITALWQYLDYGVSISFRNTEGHTINDTWTIETDLDSVFYPPLIPCNNRGFGIYPRPNTSQFYFSTLNDFSIVGALDYYYLDSVIVASLNVNDEIWFICKDSIRIWYNTGDSKNLFEQRANMIINYGSDAPYAIKKASNNIVFMLARNTEGGRVIIKIANYSSTIISDEPLNEELRSYSNVSDAFLEIIERNGHIFCMFTFPTADKTWVYDDTTGGWHQWASIFDNIPPKVDVKLGMFRGNCHVYANGKNIFGDSISGRLFEMNDHVFLDYDKRIFRERTCAHINDKNLLMAVNWLQIDVQAGVSKLIGEQKTNPLLMLHVSRDGGETWGNEIPLSIGLVGKYKNRCKTPPLGTARVFTFRIRCSDQVDCIILGAVADIEEFS